MSLAGHNGKGKKDRKLERLPKQMRSDTLKTSTGDAVSKRLLVMLAAVLVAVTALAEAVREEYGYAAAWRGHHTQDRHIGLGGCSLIAPSWVITAAHVASKKAHTPELTNVRIRFRGRTYTVDKAFCARGGDLAIAHLSRPVANVTPLAICAEKIQKGRGAFPMTWVSAGRGFRVVHDIEAEGKKQGDRIYIGKNERPGKAGDSGCAFVLDMPSPKRDILIGVLHGSGRAQQPAVFRKWIDETMAVHSGEKATWVEPPSNAYLRHRAEVLAADAGDQDRRGLSR